MCRLFFSLLFLSTYFVSSEAFEKADQKHRLATPPRPGSPAFNSLLPVSITFVL